MHSILKYKKSFSKGYGAKRKRALCSLVIAFIIIFLAFTACVIGGLSNSTAAHAADAQSNTRTVKAGIFSFEGYHIKDDDGRLTGYGIEFLNLVSEHSRLNFQYVGYENSWDDMLPMLDNGEIDVVTSASRTDEREKKYDFSLPIGRRKTVLSVRVNDTRFHRGDYESYKQMRVGLVTGSSQNADLDKFEKEHGFTCGEKKYYEKSVDLAAALQAGDIDAILSSNLRKTENEKVLDITGEDDFYAIVRKDDTDLLDEINYAIEQMDINEGDWQNVLFYRYYGTIYSSEFSFTEREKEYISQVVAGEKTITATAFGNRAPYSYIEDGQLKGIVVDYFDEVMKLAKLPYKIVVPDDSDDYDRLAGTNAVNVVMDSIGSDDAVYNAIYSGFNTDSYMTASIARVTRKNHKGDIGIVAVSDSQGKDIIGQEFLAGYKAIDYPNGDDAIRAVLNSQADAAFVYSYTAQMYINRDHTKSLYYSMMNGMNATFSMNVSDNTDHELITILNKCIKELSDDLLNQLASKYTSYTISDTNFWQYLAAHPVIIFAVVFGIIIVVGIILALYLRGRWNKKLLQSTEQSNKKMGEQLAIVEALSRDYTNVFAVDEKRATAQIIKLEGYVTEGLKKGSAEEYDYVTTLENYIRSRVHPDDRQELTQALSLDNMRTKLRADDEYTGSYRILDNGEIHHFQYTFLKIADNESGQGGFTLLGFRNIDDVISKEQEQKNALSEALAQAQYANKAKTRFLNSMSHDIRTPMNAIIGFTSLAESHIDNKEQIRDYLGKIMTSGNHLLSLINDVLDMSRIESGKVKIEEKETDLPEVMRDLKTTAQADVKAKQLEFSIDSQDVTNETIICDKLRLNQVLLNILSNAIKYTKTGGTVNVRVIQTTEAADGRASYEFRVKDTGIGMSPEFLQHVFEPFEREQTSTVSGIQGTGLGLAITKNIVDLMDGTISVDSEVDKGSEFIVKFTFRVVDIPTDAQRLEQLEGIGALVVSDDENTCESVSKMLSAIGMRPDRAAGNEAVTAVKSAIKQNEPYGAVIIDWRMPDKNGLELVRRIRKTVGDATSIIMLNVYDRLDIEKKARKAGVTAFCSKPLFLSGLRTTLAAPYAEKESADKPKKTELRFDGKKVLLVEDNELNQEIAQMILEDAGFVVDMANDGSVAVEKIKETPAGAYDVILMDVQIPIMNGYQATKAIRALDDADKASIPIVAMTANAFEEDRKEAMDAGMNGFAAKPIDIDKLMKTLEEILK